MTRSTQDVENLVNPLEERQQSVEVERLRAQAGKMKCCVITSEVGKLLCWASSPGKEWRHENKEKDQKTRSSQGQKARIVQPRSVTTRRTAKVGESSRSKK